jgi:TonB family protein
MARRLSLLVIILMAFSFRLGAVPQEQNADHQSTQGATPAHVEWQVEKKLLAGGSKPVYPAIAATAKIEGVVHVRIVVSSDGTVRDATYVSGPPILLWSAINAVKTWRFNPTMVAGAPVEVQTIAAVWFYLPDNDPERAIDKSREELNEHPNDVKAMMALASELRRAGMIQDSVAEYYAALKLQPDNPDIRLGLAEVLDEGGDSKSAIAEYNTYLAAKPKDGNATIELAILLDDSGDLDGAIAEYRLLENRPPWNANAHSELGFLLLEKADVDDAIAEFRQAESEGFSSPDFHFAFGNAFLRRSDTKNAEKEFKKAVSMAPQDQTYRDALDRVLHHAQP